MSNLQDLLSKLKQIEESTGDEKFDTMMGKVTKQPDLEPNESAHLEKFDHLIHKLGALGKAVRQNDGLWKHYLEAGNTGDWEWVYQLIQRYTGASQKDILDLSDIIDGFGTRGSGIVEFAYAVDEGSFDDDFIDPWNEYKLSFNTMEEETVALDAGATDECMDSPVEECPQDGNVQLSMQDLVKLVKALQQGGEPNAPGDQALMGNDEFDEVFGNEPSPEVVPVAAVTPTGDDMASKGDEAEKVNGGGNPLQSHLAELYAQIKERQVSELSNDTLKSYTKKAAANLNDKAYSAGHASARGENRRASNNDTKAYKRQAGIEKAVDKMSLKEANQMARSLRK